MVKKNIEILVTKTGLNGEISSIKDGKIIKSIPAVIFSKDEANRLLDNINCIIILKTIIVITS